MSIDAKNPLQIIQGYVQQGDTFNVGLVQHDYQRSYPSSTVSVYLNPSGETDPTDFAPIFDRNGGLTANPFEAGTDGYYSFYSEPGRFDIKFSDGDISTPFYLRDVQTDNLVYNVRDFGAVGDGTTDDTAAIQAALLAMEARYNDIQGVGTLFFPNGQYLVTAQTLDPFIGYVLDLPSGIIIQGTAGPYSGASTSNCKLILRQDGETPPDDKISIFNIRTNRHKIAIRDIGMTTDTEDNTNFVAIRAAEDEAYGTTQNVELSNLTIWNFDIGVSVEGSGLADQWDITQVKIDHCAVTDCDTAIYIDSENCDFLQILNCRIGANQDGYGIYFERVGLVTVDSALGAGPVSEDHDDWAETFIYTTAAHVVMNITACESEGFRKCFHVVSLETGEIAWPINLRNNTFGNTVQLDSECVVVSKGNKYLPDTVQCNELAQATIISSGDIIIDAYKTPDPNAAFNLNGGPSRVASWANQYRTDIQAPTRIGGLAGQISDVITDMPLALTPLVEDGVHMTFCGEDGNPLFIVSADDLALHVDYVPSPQRILTLDRNGNLTVLGDVTPNGTP